MRFSTGLVASGTVGAAVIALATVFLQPWEGLRNDAYLDSIASPPVWTVCYGETNPRYAYQGARYTNAECESMLRDSVGAYYARIESCMTREIPVSVQASLLELAYNVGTSGVCNSTAMRHANAGRFEAACEQLNRWVNAGGQRIRGLVNRRNASTEMCMRDLQ